VTSWRCRQWLERVSCRHRQTTCWWCPLTTDQRQSPRHSRPVFDVRRVPDPSTWSAESTLATAVNRSIIMTSVTSSLWLAQETCVLVIDFLCICRSHIHVNVAETQLTNVSTLQRFYASFIGFAFRSGSLSNWRHWCLNASTELLLVTYQPPWDESSMYQAANTYAQLHHLHLPFELPDVLQ